ncbi:MAG: hypothetical protein HY361_04580 [Candidatus Aenigmarchaeota archaeon]|nr:hypothetical protein [Candidatus Aenigmarchaeota archaeon]
MVLRKIRDWKEQSRNISVTREFKQFTESFRENFITLIVSAMGLVVALSWNDFWRAWVTTLTVEDTLSYKLVIAVLMTLLAVVLTYVFSKFKSNGN